MTEQEVVHVARKWTRPAWLFVAVLALAVIAPGIVYAATGSFSSSSSTTALTAVNSSTGKAVNAVANTGFAGTFTRNATSGTTAALYGTTKSNSNGAPAIYGLASGTGTGYQYGVYGRTNSSVGAGLFGLAAKTTGQNYGVYGRSQSASDNASGVFGGATALEGFTNGVWGQSSSEDGTGVFGLAPGIAGFGVLGIGGALGVIGVAGDPGDGTFGLFSTGDMGSVGHLVATTGQIAGTCTVGAAETSHVCAFTDSFGTGVTPIVVITPTETPGTTLAWVSAADLDDFTISVSAAPGGDGLTFNYIVVGTVPVSGTSFGGAQLRDFDAAVNR